MPTAPLIETRRGPLPSPQGLRFPGPFALGSAGTGMPPPPRVTPMQWSQRLPSESPLRCRPRALRPHRAVGTELPRALGAPSLCSSGPRPSWGLLETAHQGASAPQANLSWESLSLLRILGVWG